MAFEESKPTLRARLQATALLLDREGPGLASYVRERDREPMLRLLEAGWRQVINIKARAAVQSILAERSRRLAD